MVHSVWTQICWRPHWGNRFHLFSVWGRRRWTYQQHSDGHEGSSSGGHGAVHQDDVVLTDVFGQTEVVKLEERDVFRWNIPAEILSGWSALTHLRLARVVVGLDEDLSQSDVFADGHQRLLHRLSCSQDGNTCDLQTHTGGTPRLMFTLTGSGGRNRWCKGWSLQAHIAATQTTWLYSARQTLSWETRVCDPWRRTPKQTHSFTAQPLAVVDATLRSLHRYRLESETEQKQWINLLLMWRIPTNTNNLKEQQQAAGQVLTPGTKTHLERQKGQGVFDQEPH